MKTGKKLVGVLLLLLVIVNFAFANGTSEAVETEDELVTVKLYLPGAYTPGAESVHAELNRRMGEDINVNVDIQYIGWGDYANKMNVMVASGDDYDANFDAVWLSYPTMSQKGAYMDISELLPEYAPLIYEKISQTWLDQLTVNGELQGVPWRLPQSGRQILLVREDLREKYNIPEPKSYFDLWDYWMAIKENEPDVIPFMFDIDPQVSNHSGAYNYFMLDKPMGLVYDMDDPEMKIVPWEQTEAFKELSEFHNAAYNEGLIPNDVLTKLSGEYGGLPLVKQGRAASSIHVFESGFEANAAVALQNPDWEVKTYRFEDNKSYYTPASSQLICLGRNAANPAQVLQFLNWVVTDQANFDLLLYGIEGETYNLIDGVGPNYEPVVKDGVPQYVNWHGQWAFWDMDFMRYPESFGSEYKDLYKEANTYKTVDLPHSGFVIDTDPIKTEIAQRTAIYDEMGKAIEMGVLGPDKYDEYIERMKKAGTDEMVAVIQAQLDAWAANN
jgi:putative aldouronate transport system substrate-binding protein